jgi:outer membrane murein-binding lipoprotein Lpp|tara:strand:- start:851 stop:1093 length:243 start_codon:yes stop_codon:yes gene_type:complete
MIEYVDIGLIAGLAGKIALDEQRARNGNGKNGKAKLIAKLETAVDGLSARIDALTEEVRASRADIADNGKAISKIEGRLE